MRDRLGAPGRLASEVLRGRLWVQAARPRLVDDRPGGGVLAVEGFIATGLGAPHRSLAELLADAIEAGDLARPPDGHYSLAIALPPSPRSGRVDPTLILARSLSGGERLYTARVGDVVLFASSVRPLLAHPGVPRALDLAAADEMLLVGHPITGRATAFAGIEEVPPGHAITLSRRAAPPALLFPDALRSPEGPPERLARGFRRALERAVSAAAGDARPVAVALSGGIDSSAVAAAAVSVFGAESVVAYTYVFDDPRHPVETDYARDVAAALGIRDHRTFSIGYPEFIAAIPETVYRNESPVHWPKAFLLPVARRIAADGFDRYLTGFGIGSHMQYLDELARVLAVAPAAAAALLRPVWRRWRFTRSFWLGRLALLHPGLEPPHPRLYHLLVRLLWRAGVIRTIEPFYPAALEPLIARASRNGPGEAAALAAAVGAASVGARARAMREAMQLEAFQHLISCIDVTRSEKGSREAGLLRVSPAHFSGCLPYAYFPIRPRPRLLSAARALRPGKLLLRRAYRGILPDRVLFRRKSWADAVAGRGWLRAGRRLMLRALPRFPASLADLGAGHPDAVRFWEPRSVQASSLSFAFFRRLFFEPEAAWRDRPPTWEELIPGYEPRTEPVIRGKR